MVSRDYNSVVTAISPDDRYFAFYEMHPETSRDIWILDREGGGEPEPWLVTPANERSAKFSNDGRWIAYTSDRSGRDEVYVRPLEPVGGPDVRISIDGDREPMWRGDDGEIYYRAGNALLAVPVDLDDRSAEEPSVGAPQILFEGSWMVDPGGLNQMYEVTPDGERFLMLQNSDDLGLINVVVGWSPPQA